MIGRLLKKHKKSIITPSIASGLLLVFAALEAPKEFDYASAYIAEGVVALFILLLAAIAVNRSKKDVEKKESKYCNDLDDELSKAKQLLDIVDEKNEEGRDCIHQHINNLLKEKTESSQKKLKKQKDEIDMAQDKYELALKDKEQSQSDFEKTVDNAIKAAHDVTVN